MSIISVRDNENSRWKRNAKNNKKTSKDRKEQGGTETIVKGWELRLDLMFSLSLRKKFQLLQIFNNLSIRHLIKLILYENDVKFLKFKRSPV